MKMVLALGIFQPYNKKKKSKDESSETFSRVHNFYI